MDANDRPIDELDEIRRALETIDHPVPAIDVESIVARSQARQRRAPLLMAGVGAFVAAALAAALPSSPVRQAIERVVARHQSAPTVRRAVARPGSGIAIELHGSLARVVFRSRQTTGTVSIAEDSGHALRITEVDGAPEGSAFVGYAVVPSGVTIDNAGSRASYAVRFPVGARVVMLVGTDTVFVTGPDHATPRVIDLAAGARARRP